MSIIDSVRNAFDNLFVPKDGLYRQAKDLIAQHDADGDGRVDVSAIHSGEHTPPPGLFGITSRGFAQADVQGNGDGMATVREVRSFLEQYDTGNGWEPGAAGDRMIDGLELLRLLGDLSLPAADAAPRGARQGAEQLAA